MKSINISAENWKRFIQLKLEWNKKNADEVLEELYKRANITKY